VFKMKSVDLSKPFLRATLKYETKDSQKPIEVVLESSPPAVETKDKSVIESESEVEAQRHRLVSVDKIKEAMKLMKDSKSQKDAQSLIKDVIQEIKNSETAKSDKRVQALLKDLEGQVNEALSKSDYYKKWGVHYLPSLVNAHLLQMCNNFKDPGVQVYGGKLFTKLRDRADKIFIKLPAPKPSYNASAAPVASMGVYHRSSNPCFHGNSVAEMLDGNSKKVKDLTKGDFVISPSRKPVEILCVVKSECQDGKTLLVELPGGLLVTPYHPVQVGGKWHFPMQLGEVKEMSCPAVYSFVLKEEHVMMINGVACVTLGHNFNDDEVVRHSYFGSPRVVEDLKKFSSWESGQVNLKPGCLVRDPETNLVCGISETV